MLPERACLVLFCALALSACGTGTVPLEDSPDTPAMLQLPAGASSRALHFEGELSGGALGFGPSVSLEAWLRSDSWLRADLLYEDENGDPAHDVLIWGPESALLFDRRKGRFTELGDGPGEVELKGGAFHVRHALWLALGHWLGSEPLVGSRRGSSWRARDGEMGIRAKLGRDRAEEMEVVFRGERLRATPKSWVRTSWGQIPRETELSGTLLDAPAQLRWTVQEIPVFADSLLDPLMLP